MKKRFLLSGLLMAALSPSSFAAGTRVDCNAIQANSSLKKEKVYEFTASITCTASLSTSSDQVFNAIQKTLKGNGRISNAQNADYNGMAGSSFSYQDRKYDTGHGKISILFDSYLVSNENTVLYSAQSNSIDADGYAQNTEHVDIQIRVSIYGDSVEMTLEKTVDVEKPRVAPGFESKAKDGLKKELSLLANPYKLALQSL